MGRQLKFAICDDVLQDRQAMMDMLQKYMDVHHYFADIDEYKTGEELLEASTPVYDLVILDILMEKIDGIQTAVKLKERNTATQIIFSSISNEFAAQSYEIDALYYLVKPVEEEKLSAVLDKYFYAHTSLKTLSYKQNRMEENLYISDVLWIEAGDHKSVIHTKQGDIVTSSLLKHFAEQVDEKEFVKPIRYALVSLAAVTEIPSDVLTLADGTKIPISRAKRIEISQAFKEYKMKMLLQKGGIK